MVSSGLDTWKPTCAQSADAPPSTALNNPACHPGLARPLPGRLAGQLRQLEGLRVSNPPGYGAEPFLAAERVSVRMEPTSLLGTAIRVPEVTVDGFVVRAEREGQRTNVEALRQRVREAVAGAAR